MKLTKIGQNLKKKNNNTEEIKNKDHSSEGKVGRHKRLTFDKPLRSPQELGNS